MDLGGILRKPLLPSALEERVEEVLASRKI
jgi:hypothetical protein